MNEFAQSPWILAAVCCLFGLVFGSFLNVVILRLPRVMQRAWIADATEVLADSTTHAELALGPAESAALTASLNTVGSHFAALSPLTLSKPRSRCGSCGHQIKAIENVPIVSWLALRGRCSACRTPISPRYPIVEAATALLWGAAAFHFGPTTSLLGSLFLITLLIALTLIDADTMLLPDSLTLPLLWVGLLFNLYGGFVPIGASIIGAVTGYMAFWTIGTLFRVLRGVEGMGAGDYKLLGALGAWFGWTSVLPIVLISAGVGSIVGISLMASGRANLLTRLPFGVYLAPAGIVMLFYGQALIALVMPGAR